MLTDVGISELNIAAEDALAAEDLEGEPQDEPNGDRQWYVIHCYSGYENKVKHNLEQRIESMDMQDKIFQAIVPNSCSRTWARLS